jgi:hypothetical protein
LTLAPEPLGTSDSSCCQLQSWPSSDLWAVAGSWDEHSSAVASRRSKKVVRVKISLFGGRAFLYFLVFVFLRQDEG